MDDEGHLWEDDARPYLKTLTYNAYGADYIENILYQQMTPKKHHAPVKLKKDDLNRITLTEPSLQDYDAHVLKRRKKDD